MLTCPRLTRITIFAALAYIGSFEILTKINYEISMSFKINTPSAMNMPMTYKRIKIREVFYKNSLEQGVFLTPKALNMNNPVQAAGAARGRDNHHQSPPPTPRQRGRRNSVGVQHQPISWLSTYGAPVYTADTFTPSCGYRLARGYSHCTPTACCKTNTQKHFKINNL